MDREAHRERRNRVGLRHRQNTVAPQAPGWLTATPTESKGGNYSLSWGSVAGASIYQLWERQTFTTPCLVYTGAKTGTSFTHHVDGNYSYFAEACVNGVCSAPSTGAKVYVTGSTGTAGACLDGGGIGMQPNATSAALIVQYHYDGNGNLASVVNANTGTVYWQADANAQVPAVSPWGTSQAWTLGNGIHVQLDQDRATGAVTSIMAGPGENGASRVSLAYGYGPLGNTTSAFDVLTGVGYKLNTLTYNALNMLRQFPVYNDTGYHNRYANYKIGGNISWRTGAGSYAYTGAEPHAVTQTTASGQVTHYSYNEVGEMTSGGGLSQIQWTRAGRAKKLVGDQTTRLAYGASGTLVQKTVAGTVSRYFGKLIVKTGSTWRARIVAGGEVVAIVNVNAAGYPTTDYLVHDAQGSPAALLDASGSLIYRYAWNAWGELVNPDTGIGLDPNAAGKEAALTLGYTGHEELWQAGLVHTWARLYNPHLGRWLSPDPTVPNAYNGQSLNRYSYVLNNPMTLWDPNGLIGLNPATYPSNWHLNAGAWNWTSIGLGFGHLAVGLVSLAVIPPEEVVSFGGLTWLVPLEVVEAADQTDWAAQDFLNGVNGKAPAEESPLTSLFPGNKAVDTALQLVGSVGGGGGAARGAARAGTMIGSAIFDYIGHLNAGSITFYYDHGSSVIVGGKHGPSVKGPGPSVYDGPNGSHAIVYPDGSVWVCDSSGHCKEVIPPKKKT